jgi:hypothetical protein
MSVVEVAAETLPPFAAAQLTVTPSTGLPLSVETLTDSGSERTVPTMAD